MVTKCYSSIINHLLSAVIPNNRTFFRPLDSTVAAAGVELGFSDGDLDLVALFSLALLRAFVAASKVADRASALSFLSTRSRPRWLSATGVSGGGDLDLDLDVELVAAGTLSSTGRSGGGDLDLVSALTLTLLPTPHLRAGIAPRLLVLSVSRALVCGVWAITGDPRPFVGSICVSVSRSSL